jgi:hypothetical protein
MNVILYGDVSKYLYPAPIYLPCSVKSGARLGIDKL